jgi:hypothetical protein
MTYASGTIDVGEDLVPLCSVPEGGVRVRNLGGVTIFLGGADLPGDGGGYPVEAGAAETIQGVKPKESPVVPAPEGDLDNEVLYARTMTGTGGSKMSYISVS